MDVGIQREQHFLVDKEVVKELVKALDINQNDIILEIGAGEGFITKELVKKKGKVIAVEIDEMFEGILQKIKGDKEMVIGDVKQVLEMRSDFNKITGNIPFQISEPLLRYLCLSRKIERAVLIVPAHFVARMSNHPIFSAFLEFEVIQELEKEAFEPMPKVKTVIVKIVKSKKENKEVFIKRKLYWQRDKKLKNGLRDLLIDIYRNESGKELTKKKARGIIEKWDMEEDILERLISVMPLEYYEKIVKLIEKVDGKNIVAQV
ncbi:hypothetical protein HYX11_04430 [Candidatus Woesearchaeota archaeon]|nr:hypothetical protein [Candidatus Woesearchaeota archaeon]